MTRHDHHRPCACGAELDDECARCARTNPLGSMRIDLPYVYDRAVLTYPVPVSDLSCMSCGGTEVSGSHRCEEPPC